ncbi:MAG: type II secretion system protein GspG [Armatimonadota bacterium]|nr:type II secretion system protein GspG [Armatimonadota bacterium]
MKIASQTDTASGTLRQTLVKGPRRSRLGQGIIGFCCTASLALGGFLYWRDLPPEVNVPTPTMPSPNAYDFFNRAASLERDGNKVDYAISNVHRSGAPEDKPYSTAEKAALVQENGPALQELRTGLSYPYEQPPARSFSALMPYLSKYRQTARLMLLEAQVKGEQGDWPVAASTDLDIIRLGSAVPHGGSMIAGLVGVAITAIGQKQLWKDAEHLSAPQARDTARLLRNITFVSFGQVLQEEEWSDEAGMAEFMARPRWRGSAEAFSSEDATIGEKASFWLRMQPFSKQQIMDNYRRYMDGLVANGRLPYTTPGTEPPVPTDPINQVLLPVFSGGRFRWAKSEAQIVLLTTELELRAYSLDHHRYPSSLPELVPSYEPSNPTDPFALCSPLHYRSDGHSYLLYSVGPDGKDDGGTPCKPANGSHMDNYQIGDKGDIVVGVNTP